MLSKTRQRLERLALLVVILAAWDWTVVSGVADPFFFPRPIDIIKKAAEWFQTEEIWSDFAVTFTETVAGYIFGTAIGIASGVYLALHPRIAGLLDPFIKAFNSIPRVVLGPIFILWFGLGIGSKIALAVTLVFFVTFFNAFQGVKEVDVVVLNNARILGASRRDLLRHVYFPAAASWILSSLRTSVGFAVVGAIIGEYLGSSSGLGHLIAQAQGVFDSTGVFAGIMVLSAFVLALDAMLDRVENHLNRWRVENGKNMVLD
ncbi:MAG TPA: ABC transporter permease [Acidiferrobacterales bacterium]|nr:ABC transporter permease [Acidiferrobacterales bacterium]